MEIPYVLTHDDLRRVWQWARMPRLGLALSLGAWIVAIAGVVGLFGQGYLLGIIVGAATLPFQLAVILWHHHRRATEAAVRAVTQDATLVGPRTLRLERDGLHDIRAGSSRLYSWAQVQGLRRDSRFLLILVEDVGIVPIPLRAFATAKDAEHCWTALLAYTMSGGDVPLSFAADNTVWPPPPRSS